MMDNPELGMLAIKQIDAEPQSFRMNIWGMRNPTCGTVACLAGHVMLAAGYDLDNRTYFRPDGTAVEHEGTEAAKLLGMSYCEERPGGLRIWSDARPGPKALHLFREMVEKSLSA